MGEIGSPIFAPGIFEEFMRTFSELLADLKAVGTVAVLLVFLRLFRQDIQALFRTLFGH